jgi:hypothetical protein
MIELKQMKKPTKQQHLRHQKRHRIIVGLSIVVVAALLGLIFALIVIPRTIDSARLHRINEIYSSIKMPAIVYNETDMIFGDRRISDLARNLTTPSYKTFVISDTVTGAFNTMNQAIIDTGAVAIKNSNPDSVAKQADYKTTKGEYIQLVVQSKLRLDAFQNAIWMNDKISSAFANIDPNSGPALVTLSVNLDDNNE